MFRHILRPAFRLALPLLLTLAGLPALAQAQTPPACQADVQKFCLSAGPAQNCLLDHQQDISDGCYNALKQRLDNQRGLAACKQDVGRLCQGVQPGGGRLVNCLLDHQKEVSDGCYAMLAKRMDKGNKRP